MKKVTSIEFIKNGNIRITFNKTLKFTINEGMYIQMPLQIDDELDEDQLYEFEQLLTFNQCYQKALDYISRAPHSIRLLTRKLTQKRLFHKKVIEEALNKLTDLGYLNDEKFCQLFIEQKRNKFDWGEYKIRQKLNGYGIKKEIIEKFMSTHYTSTDEEIEKAKKAFEKKWKCFTMKDPFMKKKEKTTSFLIRKGFKMDIIRQVMQEKLTNEGISDDSSNF